jgi:hypothetical protein
MGVLDVQVHRVRRRTRDIGSWHYGRVQAHPSAGASGSRTAPRSGDPSRRFAKITGRNGVALSQASVDRGDNRIASNRVPGAEFFGRAARGSTFRKVGFQIVQHGALLAVIGGSAKSSLSRRRPEFIGVFSATSRVIQRHAGTVPPRHDAEVVMLDFVQRAAAGRRRFSRRRQARFDDAKFGAGNVQRHDRLIETAAQRAESRARRQRPQYPAPPYPPQ